MIRELVNSVDAFMKYFVSINNSVSGPYDLNELWLLEEFNPQTLVYPEDSKEPNAWQYADSVPELLMVFNKFTKKIATKLKETPIQQEKTGKSLKILSIDDDPLIRELLWDIMNREGHEMQFAKDGIEIFQRVAKARFDLLILDVNMPNSNGYKISEEITSRHLPEARPKILLFTSRNIKEEKVQFNLSGADAILQKDVGIDVILAKVYELVGLTPKTVPVSQASAKAKPLEPLVPSPAPSQGKTVRIVPAKEKIVQTPAVASAPAQRVVCEKDRIVKEIESLKSEILENRNDIALVLTGQKEISGKMETQMKDFAGLNSRVLETEKRISAIRKQMGRLYLFILLFFLCISATLLM